MCTCRSMSAGNSSYSSVALPGPSGVKSCPPHFGHVLSSWGTLCSIVRATSCRFFSAFSRLLANAAAGSVSTPASRSSSATRGIFSDRFPKTCRCSFSSVAITPASFSPISAFVRVSSARVRSSSASRLSARSRHSHRWSFPPIGHCQIMPGAICPWDEPSIPASSASVVEPSRSRSRRATSRAASRRYSPPSPPASCAGA